LAWNTQLFHEPANLKVELFSDHVDTRLATGCLVSMRLKRQWLMTDDAVQIERLVLLEIPVSALNLFATIPPGWVRDRGLVARGQALWALLPRHFQHLFNAMFWDGKRFQRFVNSNKPHFPTPTTKQRIRPVSRRLFPTANWRIYGLLRRRWRAIRCSVSSRLRPPADSSDCWRCKRLQ
jgi:hypothetical protein